MPLILLEKNRKYTDVVANGRYLPSVKEFSQIIFTFFRILEEGHKIIKKEGIKPMPSMVNLTVDGCKENVESDKTDQ